jgi:L-aspartate oxidase
MFLRSALLKFTLATDCDFLVIGAGVAGMRAAIELAQSGTVLVIAKDSLRESSSEYAQGGIAAALNDDDRIELHQLDTIYAGDGLCNVQAVHALVEEAPGAIQDLIGWGAEFDRESEGKGAKLVFAREGAHSRNRVLHAHGDSTGHEIARTLYRKAVSLPNVRFETFSAVVDLLRYTRTTETGESVLTSRLVDRAGPCAPLRYTRTTETGESVLTSRLVDRAGPCALLTGSQGVAGATALEESTGRLHDIRARAVLLATGGLGCVYSQTTNPAVATGDGVAMAWRAGAEIANMEFVQFHPTALHLEGAPRFLLSEALRGEGAVLRNCAGEAFMRSYHELGDLAPRDVVSRAIVAEMQRTESPHVWLDATALGSDFIRQRFPRIFETCLALGLDLGRDAAPVHPSAHYAMGGVHTDLDGRTSIAGLYAAGEVACTGVHGANRLASNSLLEGLVFGARAGRAMSTMPPASASDAARPAWNVPDVPIAQLRDLTWRHCGILRSAEGLELALRSLDAVTSTPVGRPAIAAIELRNVYELAGLIARSALWRRESRGAHYRTDYPEKSPSFERNSSFYR